MMRFSLAALMLLPLAAQAGDTPAPKDAYLYIGWPNDGEILNTGNGKPFRVWFGLRNMGVAPAEVDVPNTGHHHLLIDTDLPPLDEPIPADDNHVHFGRGQTQTQIVLPPGQHTLQLIMGDYAHMPHNPPVVSKKITITVR
ncbi:MAG: DUF4399 domain-containing protein [Alphaproteobacteria bacterium]